MNLSPKLVKVVSLDKFNKKTLSIYSLLIMITHFKKLVIVIMGGRIINSPTKELFAMWFVSPKSPLF